MVKIIADGNRREKQMQQQSSLTRQSHSLERSISRLRVVGYTRYTVLPASRTSSIFPPTFPAWMEESEANGGSRLV